MRTITLSLLLIFTLTLESQAVQFNPSSLSFGSVSELDSDSLSVNVMNNTASGVRIKRWHLPSFFGHQPYRARPRQQIIPAQGNGLFHIRLKARHNIDLSGMIIAETDSFYGCLILPTSASCQYDKSYYNSSFDLHGQALFNALRSRISSPYIDVGYNTARDNMYSSIDNTNGQVECVYTGRTATFSTRSGANNNSFNCEHTFPQGFFNSASPMKSDIHHLFPTDVNANSQRGNLPFGIVTSSPSWQQGGSKKGNGVFEPRDVHKGTVARAMLYFVLRHQDFSNFLSGQESLLRNWSTQYPPNADDIARNNAIHQLQQNRNPFVDYPAFLDRLGAFSNNGSLSSPQRWTAYPDTLYMRQGIAAQIVLHGEGTQSATVQLNGSDLNWTPTQGSSPYSAGYHLGELEMNQNTSGSTTLDLIVGGTVVDQVYVFYQASGLSIDETATQRISFFPNPADDQLYVRVPSNRPVMVQVYSLTGKRLIERELSSTEEPLDVSMLAGGVYLLRSKHGDLWQSDRLLIH